MPRFKSTVELYYYQLHNLLHGHDDVGFNSTFYVDTCVTIE